MEYAPGQSTLLTLCHVRCRRCHTMETVFPPWLLPYESLTVEMLESLLNAIEIRGESLEAVAAAYQVSVERVQARWHQWRAVLSRLALVLTDAHSKLDSPWRASPCGDRNFTGSKWSAFLGAPKRRFEPVVGLKTLEQLGHLNVVPHTAAHSGRVVKDQPAGHAADVLKDILETLHDTFRVSPRNT